MWSTRKVTEDDIQRITEPWMASIARHIVEAVTTAYGDDMDVLTHEEGLYIRPHSPRLDLARVKGAEFNLEGRDAQYVYAALVLRLRGAAEVVLLSYQTDDADDYITCIVRPIHPCGTPDIERNIAHGRR
jgi:hypothetical protein